MSQWEIECCGEKYIELYLHFSVRLHIVVAQLILYVFIYVQAVCKKTSTSFHLYEMDICGL